MSNQENNQKQIQFQAQQELKHLRTRCGKVYALGNNRFRAVVQTKIGRASCRERV